MIYRILTPEERARTEDAMNAAMASDPSFARRRVRVCLHPDRTAARRPEGGYRIECDYCPEFAVVEPGGTWPDIEPRYYDENNP